MKYSLIPFLNNIFFKSSPGQKHSTEYETVWSRNDEDSTEFTTTTVLNKILQWIPCDTSHFCSFVGYICFANEPFWSALVTEDQWFCTLVKFPFFCTTGCPQNALAPTYRQSILNVAKYVRWLKMDDTSNSIPATTFSELVQMRTNRSMSKGARNHTPSSLCRRSLN